MLKSWRQAVAGQKLTLANWACNVCLLFVEQSFGEESILQVASC